MGFFDKLFSGNKTKKKMDGTTGRGQMDCTEHRRRENPYNVSYARREVGTDENLRMKK